MSDRPRYADDADALAAESALVRSDPSAYGDALARVVARIPPDAGAATRLSRIVDAVDKLAFAMIDGALERDGGADLAGALDSGRFDGFLRPSSVEALRRRAGAAPLRRHAARNQADVACKRRRFHLEDRHA